ncbi:MAG TPA: serine hydrolase [Candidatus Gemmiger faecigallinarum]|nr:serine hydrolase [Candidatus Gemmiger faecigallinarum]
MGPAGRQNRPEHRQPVPGPRSYGAPPQRQPARSRPPQGGRPQPRPAQRGNSRRPPANRRRRRRDTPRQAAGRFFIPFFLTLAICLPLAFLLGNGLHARSAAESPADQAAPAASPTPAPTPSPTPVTVDLSGLNSSSAILIQRGGGVLGQLQADEPLYPASMTKIMTVLLAVENLTDLDAPATLDPDMFQELWAENASMAGLAPGETVTVRDLLYGSLLPSGAECSIAIAQLVDGDVQTFADRMNRRAAELGMTGTHFVNPTGLHDPEHVSTVRDIALLLDAALQNETFRTVFTAKQYTTTATEAHPDGVTLTNTMFAMLGTDAIADMTLLGGKTGYTDEAGQCLASLAEKNGTEYILVTAGAPGNNHGDLLQIDDEVTVYTRLSALIP